MSGWLLDTRLFKHLAPGKGGRKPSLRDVVGHSAQPIFLSVISVVDISARIQKVRDLHQGPRAAALNAWLQGIVADYGDRIYPVDAGVAMRAGELMNQSRGFVVPSLSDVLLAATAQVHDHALLTERTTDFIPMRSGVTLLDPFEQ